MATSSPDRKLSSEELQYDEDVERGLAVESIDFDESSRSHHVETQSDRRLDRNKCWKTTQIVIFDIIYVQYRLNMKTGWKIEDLDKLKRVFFISSSKDV